MESWTEMNTPVGRVRITGGDKGLIELSFVRKKSTPKGALHPVVKTAKRQLEEYFKGKRKSFKIPLDLRGTPFQKKVWKTLLRIPYGKTKSYGEIARAVGNPGAARAVGSANGRNPVAIIVPCHRVIRSGGGLGGYSAGLSKKRVLLDLEGADCR